MKRAAAVRFDTTGTRDQSMDPVLFGRTPVRAASIQPRTPVRHGRPRNLSLVLTAFLVPAAIGCSDQTGALPVTGRTDGLGWQEHGGGPPLSVVFHSARDGNLEIYRMNADGSVQERVTRDTPSTVAADTWPDLASDGQHLTFASLRNGDREIVVLNSRTGERLNLSDDAGDDNWPRFSPNGRQVAFHSNRAGNYEIYIANADGSGAPQRVTDNTVLDQWPDWSPDGSRIAFRRENDIYVADADGVEKNVRRLTFLPATIDQMPVWSPNGKQIAFMSQREGYCAVFVMDAEGETAENPAVNLTPKAGADANNLWCSRAPAWSRNGREIYFTSFRPSTGGNTAAAFEIFVMNADGTDVRRLTIAAGEDGGARMR